MIADAVEGFRAQVERSQRNISPPRRMIESIREKEIECIFAGVSARPVSTVVSEGNCFGQCNVEPECSRDARCHLCDFQRMGEPGALVVVGENKDLCFAGKPAKRGSVQNAISVPFKTRPPCIRFLGPLAHSSAAGAGRPRHQEQGLPLLSSKAINANSLMIPVRDIDRCRRVFMGCDDWPLGRFAEATHG